MIWRIATPLMQLCFLLLAVWAAWSGALQAPMFQAEARAAQPPEAVDPDDWRFGDLRSLMVPKLYNLHAANAWLDAGTAASDDGDAEGLQKASDTAARHAKAALSYSPAHGFAWTALAWSALQRGGDEEAKALLAISRTWTPYSRDLALTRVMLDMRDWPEMDKARREALLNELALARLRGSRPRLMEMVEKSPRLSVLWSMTRHRLRAQRRAAREQAQ